MLTLTKYSTQGEELTTTAIAPASSNETIHVFAVASGHLYERLMKIMVLSVIKRTQRPVKFWFIKNYLSPRFKVGGSIIAPKSDFVDTQKA